MFDDWRIRYLLECLPQIAWTARANGALDCCNKRALDYTGMSGEQLQGWGWKAVVHPKDLPSCLQRGYKATRTGTSYAMEYRLRAGDGNYRWHLMQVQPIRDAEGRIAQWFGTCTDIDAYKSCIRPASDGESGQHES
ncbi:PAS domain-containing protein [Gloeobacter violaceus]|uniref:histidine kinase n=1 Tax=Gloeobacter violaceus (strain ATCC 29082 / PCC 7421) TaxID=251221 RepID=Q7NF64_GLOVI|nr:PAS sensor domain-containing protein [Gloeobacter violaceus]BAC91603.1 gll3662 [Gloeobacter violaceus PCC 7421]